MCTLETSESIKNIAAALHKFQGNTHGVVKDSKNPHFKNRYASLEAVIEAARPGLQDAGLSFVQAPGRVVSGVLEVSTMLMHSASGEWIRSTMNTPLQKQDPQGVGSAITYCCRYALMASLGLPPVDDDGEATRAAPIAQRFQEAERAMVPEYGPETITPSEAAHIIHLLEESQSDPVRFARYMGVPSIKDIPASDFDRAITAIAVTAKKKKNGANAHV